MRTTCRRSQHLAAVPRASPNPAAEEPHQRLCRAPTEFAGDRALYPPARRRAPPLLVVCLPRLHWRAAQLRGPLEQLERDPSAWPAHRTTRAGPLEEGPLAWQAHQRAAERHPADATLLVSALYLLLQVAPARRRVALLRLLPRAELRLRDWHWPDHSPHPRVGLQSSCRRLRLPPFHPVPLPVHLPNPPGEQRLPPPQLQLAPRGLLPLLASPRIFS
mmetsp:Transcript_89542/g.208551  ORF Transcript_89542/g.208551 Transcript_89542/m.208551 type:complete len:218 (+) Transcript_89542:165-818(+)